MDKITTRINAFVKLGEFLSQFNQNEIAEKDSVALNHLFFDGFKHQLKLAQEHNSWFTKSNLLFACENWASALTQSNIQQWVADEKLDTVEEKVVAIIMAGNIPLVGFHDFIAVLISGHSVLVKQSSNDKHLLPFLAKFLEITNNDFKGKIKFTEEKLENFDAVIATGSNNTARYFDYYFKDKPNIIRKNRNSIAVLTGNETEKELENFSNDIFQYFGLGCRSVSKLFVPKDYDFDNFFKGMYNKQEIIHNAKYANNYDYNKAVYLMSKFDILENGFLMIKEDQSYSSPIASVFYEFYEDKNDLRAKIEAEKDQIQCVVSKDFIEDEIPFGHTQQPKLWDYADGVNTLDFLSKI